MDKEAFPMEGKAELRLEHGDISREGQRLIKGNIRGNWRMVNKTGEKEGRFGAQELG